MAKTNHETSHLKVTNVAIKHCTESDLHLKILLQKNKSASFPWSANEYSLGMLQDTKEGCLGIVMILRIE